MYVQNTEIANSQYVLASKAYFGKNVDNNRTAGNVTIPAGVNYEMEITGEAVLAPGFEVEQGAEFSVSLSDY